MPTITIKPAPIGLFNTISRSLEFEGATLKFVELAECGDKLMAEIVLSVEQ
jgi:hypothetical protein